MIKNVKKICVVTGIIFIIVASAYISACFSKNRADKALRELNSRYSDIEESNFKLTEKNKNLIDTNSRLREQLGDSKRVVESIRFTIEELETGAGESKTIIERVEKTARAIREIAKKLPEKIIVLEKNNDS